jgi:hypothetical protein
MYRKINKCQLNKMSYLGTKKKEKIKLNYGTVATCKAGMGAIRVKAFEVLELFKRIETVTNFVFH